jgi:hypothetical protein
MHALTARLQTAPPPLLVGTPLATLAALSAFLIACIALVHAAVAPAWTTAVMAIVAGHGALLVTALAWREDERPRPWWAAPVVAVALLAAITLATAAHPAGAATAFVIPIWLWARADRVSFAPRYVAAGIGVGAALGAHLLLSASLTLGYHAAFDISRVAVWLAYDAGISVPAAECFFRGALFERAQRRWPIPAATTLSVSLGVGRYLVDPLLPLTAEMVAGTIFYTGLLGIANCWLFRRTFSVLPGALAAVVFFAAYRLVAP